jgi:uncharacterized membrane protein
MREPKAILIILLIILFIFVYSVYEKVYLDRIKIDETDKINRICDNPYMYGCDDLELASSYCNKAYLEWVKKCV